MAREEYGLVHGELGPDHVLVTPAGEAVMIDFEGLAYFDIEWDHAWLQMRFGDTYPTCVRSISTPTAWSSIDTRRRCP